MEKTKKCPICNSDMRKGKNKIPLINPFTKRTRVVYGYNCTRCGYRTAM